ncbi:CG17669 [Drosophila busckii]|uniref:CG17669 n=1 Tax=Drosophila busckii TaxID=30019 RepID=A0A0M4ED81_DROBS|nr:dynein assembly factor 3, axonemal homolog [Drosophila busckii]ALC40876.1 CG17669 [Drosophila busckii]
MFWGLSSALDLYQEYLKAFKLSDEPAATEAPAELNILLCGAADPRHVIKTLAKRYTHGSAPKLNIYMLDACVEIVARNMLLLGLALEPAESFSLLCKAHLFMDIYGNTLLRPSSHYYMATKGRTLLNIVCDEDKRQQLAPMLDIQGLKYKERDGLETAFSYWQPQKQIYDIKSYWEQRVRALLGTRFDHREGAFDWDLSMTLKNREAQQICSQEYRYWRECGVAFVFPEYEHCKPNKTLAAGLVPNGRSYVHRGYVGDIQTGPFCGFGLRSSEERMHNCVHGENDYRATDVTERNLLELFHELHTQTPYEHDKSISRRYGCTKLLMTPLLTYNESDVHDKQQRYDQPWITFPHIQLHFLSSVEMYELKKGAQRWQNFFDIAFMGYNYFSFLSKEFFGIMRLRSLFLLETKLLTVERNEQVKKFEEAAKKLLKDAGLRPCINYQAINGKFMHLKYKKPAAGKELEEDEFEEEQSIEPKDDEEKLHDEAEVAADSAAENEQQKQEAPATVKLKDESDKVDEQHHKHEEPATVKLQDESNEVDEQQLQVLTLDEQSL